MTRHILLPGRTLRQKLQPLWFVLLCLSALPLPAATPAPAPFGAVPSARQLAWQQLQAYAFVHFTINTFTDKEWGYGDESPELFNPSAFDADQIVRTAKEAGLRGIVLTAKHHDGFCLWPSKYTEHSIAHSPYKGGKGDIVREISDACRRHGLKFGVYLSPWDRNRADYGQPSYIAYYRNQLRELLTNYGPIFEVWFDGANGGDGYYGGAREKRTIDKTTYYDWQNTWSIVRELQPQAVMFSDAGPDARWVGNENGVAGDPCWATINASDFFPGQAERLENGDRFGAQWLPAEVDVSIRPGWFYHASEDAKVKTPAELYSIYLTSVGRGANLILNLAPDRRGIIPEGDVASLRAWRQALDATFRENLVTGATVVASNTRHRDATFAPERALDGDSQTYWSADDSEKTAELVLDLGRDRTFDLVRLTEFLPLGQRIDRVTLEAWDASTGAWREFATATSVGAQRLLPTAPTTTRKVRLRFAGAACPAISEVGLYQRPRL
ncbi:glycoside hydrolase family 29 [Opitutaceae bacterium EW11]|nr:glycoside hydrolase family 29 [Opitutaceae bacterium EW11]